MEFPKKPTIGYKTSLFTTFKDNYVFFLLGIAFVKKCFFAVAYIHILQTIQGINKCRLVLSINMKYLNNLSILSLKTLSQYVNVILCHTYFNINKLFKIIK